MAPGSIAYDIPIPLGGPKLHIFPEFKWDPSFIIVGEIKGFFALFSAGLAFMVEI